MDLTRAIATNERRSRLGERHTLRCLGRQFSKRVQTSSPGLLDGRDFELEAGAVIPFVQVRRVGLLDHAAVFVELDNAKPAVPAGRGNPLGKSPAPRMVPKLDLGFRPRWWGRFLARRTVCNDG